MYSLLSTVARASGLETSMSQMVYLEKNGSRIELHRFPLLTGAKEGKTCTQSNENIIAMVKIPNKTQLSVKAKVITI